ncbi:hypothetical protein FOVG_18818 [Fusarium oxysporum f. sp. pisi HDV247]|uniref:Uncharacterized protein n=1 Tax=Fusarium oxysporum f. sp. pisi HDV247 TaxID=1080344 RepID=W9NG73_FUSOX|nr:hypothetical protein FOVG_18817 [Fusarium oxysporum f. sp. pisi HDV247]EXA29737.1 hypothetical protein FOVG_18818 [Fusarium oxysporum f. sp. pisi HDV247]
MSFNLRHFVLPWFLESGDIFMRALVYENLFEWLFVFV